MRRPRSAREPLPQRRERVDPRLFFEVEDATPMHPIDVKSMFELEQTVAYPDSSFIEEARRTLADPDEVLEPLPEELEYDVEFRADEELSRVMDYLPQLPHPALLAQRASPSRPPPPRPQAWYPQPAPPPPPPPPPRDLPSAPASLPPVAFDLSLTGPSAYRLAAYDETMWTKPPSQKKRLAAFAALAIGIVALGAVITMSNADRERGSSANAAAPVATYVPPAVDVRPPQETDVSRIPRSIFVADKPAPSADPAKKDPRVRR